MLKSKFFWFFNWFKKKYVAHSFHNNFDVYYKFLNNKRQEQVCEPLHNVNKWKV